MAGAALATAALSLAGPLQAQTANGYPNHPVVMLVPTAAGGTTDIAARMLGVPLGTALGQTIVVDNKGGANGAIAAVAVKRAEPDGYTLLMQYSGSHVITPLVSKQTQQWQASDLTPVANVLSAPQIVVIRADLPIKTMAELVAYAKAHPGKLRVLATTGKTRLPSLPDVPTTAEAGLPKLDATSWFAVFAPARTPKPIIDKLSSEIAKVVATPAFKQKALEQGAVADYQSPQQMADAVKLESARWAEVVKATGIEAD
ncbi:MAG TPA: tripartite tricarboxylate transporter substrate binding protein [Ramlibacter sp.]